MSIEKKIDELIAALDRNTKALNNFQFPNILDALADEQRQQEADEQERRENAEAADLAFLAEINAREAAERARIKEEKQSGIADLPPLKYEDTVTAFRQFIGKNGRDKAAEVLTKFGIKGKLTQEQLPEARYQEFLEALK